MKELKINQKYRILSSLGTHGMSGLDRLYRFMVVKELLKYTEQAKAQADKNWKETLNSFYKILMPTQKLIGLFKNYISFFFLIVIFN